ncbi:MAG: hypothetical protein JSS51_04395 [Planctomycetes bacterium]|nr:hypothetical protein [Planctomycetota bacterium]
MGSQGQVLLDDDGRVVLNSSGQVMLLDAGGTCPTCCETLSGPCCGSQDCTLIDNGAGNWTFTVSTSLAGSINVPAYPGGSPAFSATYDAQASKAVTLSGLAHCNQTWGHLWQVQEDVSGQSNYDPDAVLSSVAVSHTVGYYNPIGPIDGCGQFGVGLSGSVYLNAGSNYVSPGTLIYGTPQSGNVRLQCYCSIYQNAYIGTGMTSQPTGDVVLRVEVYADGTCAVWWASVVASVTSSTFTLSTINSGACVRYAELAFTIASRPTGGSADTTHTGTLKIGFTSGVQGCTGARGCGECARGPGEDPGVPE